MVICSSDVMANQSELSANLVKEFKRKQAFFNQFEVGKKLVAAHDKNVLRELEPLLTADDRHVRANAAFVFAGLRDERGFATIKAILQDFSKRSPGDIPGGNWTLKAQIASDRYYAAHILGGLKDKRAVPILAALLKDPDVRMVVPWALEEIGDRSAIPPLISVLSESDPSMRVMAIEALEKLHAREALPHLERLLADKSKAGYGEQQQVSVTARKAITSLRKLP